MSEISRKQIMKSVRENQLICREHDATEGKPKSARGEKVYTRIEVSAVIECLSVIDGNANVKVWLYSPYRRPKLELHKIQALRAGETISFTQATVITQDAELIK